MSAAAHHAPTEGLLDGLAGLLAAHTGVHRPHASALGLLSHARRAMAGRGLTDPRAYLELLRADAAALDELVADYVIGETYFLRDPAQWDAVRSVVLPDLLGRRPEGHELRAWSAGCATGEEAYTLAIVLDEAHLGARSRILATDVSRASLARAAHATYGRWSLRGVPRSVVTRHFVPQGDRVVLREHLRARVELRPHNLVRDAYPCRRLGAHDLDLIVCRNVLIYFDAHDIRHVTRKLVDSLAPGGWLVLGACDTPPASDLPLESFVTPGGLIYRRTDAAHEPAESSRVQRLPRSGTRVAVGRAFAPVAAPPTAFEPVASPAAWLEPVAAPSAAFQPVPAPAAPATQVADVASDAAPPPASATLATTPDSARPAHADTLDAARAALAQGEPERAIALAGKLPHVPEAAVLCVRATANHAGSADAIATCALALDAHPTCAELWFLRGVLQLDQGDAGAAHDALSRVLYLDRSVPLAHFALGLVHLVRGQVGAARKAYARARDLAAAAPADAPLAFGEGELSGGLRESAEAELALLGPDPEVA